MINRLLEFLEEFIRRDGSIFSYLSLSDSAHDADSAPFLREVNAARLPEPVAFVVYLYLLKTQQLNLPNNLASDPSETERAQARPTFKNIISTRVIRRFFDPNLFWSKTSEVRGILEFYQQVLESLNHGGITSDAVAHRVWFSPDVDQATRISVIQEMIDRIQTELSIRKVLAPHL